MGVCSSHEPVDQLRVVAECFGVVGESGDVPVVPGGGYPELCPDLFLLPTGVRPVLLLEGEEADVARGQHPQMVALATDNNMNAVPSVSAIGVSMASLDKHLEKIRGELQAGETIVAHVYGVIADPPASNSGTVGGALVITDRRFMFSGSALMSKTSRTFPLAQVTSIDLHKNLMFAHVQVTLAGGFERFLVNFKNAGPFVEAAHRVLATVHSPAPAAASVADELAKFAALRDQGILTEDEFAARKAALLG